MIKKVLIILLLSFFFGKLYCQSDNDTIPKIKADTLIGLAKTFLGIHYKYGSINPKAGFDCSGFVYYVFKSFNIKVPRASMQYEKEGKIIHQDSSRIGDVIVFTGTNAKIRKPGHVGIVISSYGEELAFIHSSSNRKHGGVIISRFNESPYYKKRFIKVVRLNCVEIN